MNTTTRSIYMLSALVMSLPSTSCLRSESKSESGSASASASVKQVAKPVNAARPEADALYLGAAWSAIEKTAERFDVVIGKDRVNCALLNTVRDRLCTLSERICTVEHDAGTHGGKPRCDDARKRCEGVRTRAEARCP